MKFAYAGVATLFASLFLLATSASAEVTFCPPGGSAGKCADARGVAVDTETGHVYVADRGNNRVNVFQSDGTFLTSFGGGQLSSPTWIAVDNDATSTSRHDVWVTTGIGAGDEFLVKKFKPDGTYIEADSFGDPLKEGTGPCEFSANEPIGVGPDGNVYVGDSYDKDGPGPSHVFDSRVIVFDAAGSCLKEVPLPFEGIGASLLAFTVDSEEEFYTLYNGGGNVIRKYDASGALLYGVNTRGAKGFGIDDSDRLFVSDQDATVVTPTAITLISLYSPAGELIRRFGYGPVGRSIQSGVAPYSSVNGDVYVTGYFDGVKYIALPPPGPVLFPKPCAVKAGGLGSVSATLQAEINPENAASTFHFEYVSQAEFEAEGYANPSESSEAPLPGAVDYELHEAATKVEGLTPESVYHCRVVAKNSDGNAPKGQDGIFKTREGFEFGPAWTSEVVQTSATVEVEGNPLGLAANGEIEYVDDAKYQANGFTEAQAGPPGQMDFGAGEAMQRRSAELKGLVPGTLYHWRLRVKNGIPPGGIICPEQKATCPELEHTFRTYLAEPGGFDGRRYELVSPGEKHSAEVAVPGNAGGFIEFRALRIAAAADSGDAVTYTSWTSFGNAQGAPGASQYLSKRTATGWATVNISPFGLQESALIPSYNGFSADLNFAALTNRAPAIAPGCPEGFNNLYLRDNQAGTLQCLTSEAPDGFPAALCLNYAGASQDGSRAFFSAAAAYADAPTAAGTSLYEWHEGALRLVSILPDGTPAAPTKKTSFGPGDANCQVGSSILQHVVSIDGSRVFWTYVPPEPQPSRLLARVNGTESVQLDALSAVKPGAGPPGNGVFRAASSDGSVVYFTDESRLIAGSKSAPAEPDLYRYEIGAASPLTNLTRSTSAAGDVRGVVGTSEDGSYLYFVAGAVLSGEEESDVGETAVASKANLYLYHSGAIRFIATLASADPDAGDWGEQPKGLSARVSPDGRHLAFLSIESEALAGYDNRLAAASITGGTEHCLWETLTKKFTKGGPLCPQAFVYDADANSLTCASCNPSGARPLGPTLLPGWSNVYEGPRYLGAPGSRLFFETYDALLPADRNLQRDVYEFELPGEGTCTAANPNFDPTAGGCHFLVSSGKSGDASYFIDASATGRDAFIATRQQLSGWDVNENFDVYDVREGGGFPEPPPVPPACSGETCKPPPAAQPPASSPSTPAFSGPGNVKPTKPKHKRHQTKKKHRKNDGKKRKGSSNRTGGRR